MDGGQFIKSRDFQGSHDCERPHKIVEFELPAARDLLLQFSGSGEESLLLANTRGERARRTLSVAGRLPPRKGTI